MKNIKGQLFCKLLWILANTDIPTQPTDQDYSKDDMVVKQ